MSSTAASVEERPERAHRVVLVGCFTALSLALHVPGLVVRLFTSDEATVATIARVMNEGGQLYRDVADRKPPVVPYVYAGIFRVVGSVDLRPVRLLGALVLAAVAILLATEASRRYGSRWVGLWCGGLFLLAYASSFPGDAQAATFELFMLLPMTAAVIAAGRGRALQAGLWLGLACLCKQTAATTIVPVALLLVRRKPWPHVVLAGATTSAVVGLAALMFGPRSFWLWTVAGNRGYLAYQGSPTGTMLRGLAMTGAVAAMNAPMVALCVVAMIRRRPTADLLLWTAGAAVSVAAGLRFFGHYYLQLLPPLALIAAGALPHLRVRARRLVMACVAVPALASTALGFVPLGDNASIPWGAIASRVRMLSGRRDTVFVWGDLPEVYLTSERDPATRFIQTGFVTGNSGGRANGSGHGRDGLPGAWSMLGSDLRRHPPALIVDTSRTAIRQADYYPLTRSPIWSYVQQNYRHVATVDGVWLLRHVAHDASGSGTQRASQARATR